MQQALQIHFHDIPHSAALEERIRDKAAKLEQYHAHIMSCRVSVELLRRHFHQGREFRVTVDVRVPGHQIVANRDHDEDVYVVLRDAFDSARRELEDIVRAERAR